MAEWGFILGAAFWGTGVFQESAELVMALWPGGGTTASTSLDADAVRAMRGERWYGKANRLSVDDPVPWEAIDHVALASRKR